MDPVTIATAATSLLVPFFKDALGSAGKAAGEALTEPVKEIAQRLFAKLKEKLTGRGGADKLDELAANPDDAVARAAAQKQVEAVVAEDPDLRSTVQSLLAEAEKAGATWISVSGSGAVAKDHSVAGGAGSNVAGGNITINQTP